MLAGLEHKHSREHQVAPAAHPQFVQHPRAAWWSGYPTGATLGWALCSLGYSCAADPPQASLLDFIYLVCSLQMDGGIEEHTNSSEAPLALEKKLGFREASDSLGRFTGLQFLDLYRHSVPAAVPKGPGNNCSGARSSHTGLGGFSVTNLGLAHNC